MMSSLHLSAEHLTLAVSRAQEPERGTSRGCWASAPVPGSVRDLGKTPVWPPPTPTGLGKGARCYDSDPGALQTTNPLHLLRSQRTVTRWREPKRGFKHPGEMRLVGKPRL